MLLNLLLPDMATRKGDSLISKLRLTVNKSMIVSIDRSFDLILIDLHGAPKLRPHLSL